MAVAGIGKAGFLLFPRNLPAVTTRSSRLFVTSISASSNQVRINYRENGLYKHRYLSAPTSLCTLVRQMSVTRKTSYTDFGHKRRPLKWGTLYTILAMLFLVTVGLIEKTDDV